jgi:multisubunit Na+/H+ antiporter MnhC subunit
VDPLFIPFGHVPENEQSRSRRDPLKSVLIITLVMIGFGIQMILLVVGKVLIQRFLGP